MHMNYSTVCCKFNATHIEHACGTCVTFTRKCNAMQGHAMTHMYDQMSMHTVFLQLIPLWYYYFHVYDPNVMYLSNATV